MEMSSEELKSYLESIKVEMDLEEILIQDLREQIGELESTIYDLQKEIEQLGELLDFERGRE